MFSAFFSKIKNISINPFVETWLEQRYSFINTIDFENMLRTLTVMGGGGLVLDVL